MVLVDVGVADTRVVLVGTGAWLAATSVGLPIATRPLGAALDARQDCRYADGATSTSLAVLRHRDCNRGRWRSSPPPAPQHVHRG